MANSVESYINAQPEQAMSLQDYWSSHGGTQDITDPQNKFANLFTGKVDKIKNEYDTYLRNLFDRNEFLAQQSARGFDKMMDDTKTQRMMKDYAAAGLNPYLLVNNGGVSASSAPSGAKADYSKEGRKVQQKTDNGRNVALLLIAFARVAAALL